MRIFGTNAEFMLALTYILLYDNISIFVNEKFLKEISVVMGRLGTSHAAEGSIRFTFCALHLDD
jgi:hypothetical protein